MVRQRGSGHPASFAQRPNGQAFRTRTHQCAQHRQAMFGPKSRELRRGDVEVEWFKRIVFHISRNIEMIEGETSKYCTHGG